MGKPAASMRLVPVLAMALAACTPAKEPEVDPNIVPTNYKQEILNTLTNALDDPTNIREAYVSDPVLTKVGAGQHYTVCVRFNVRDLSRRERIAYFYGGHLNQLVEATKEQCGNAAYKPFPELEKLCLASKCG